MQISSDPTTGMCPRDQSPTSEALLISQQQILFVFMCLIPSCVPSFSPMWNIEQVERTVPFPIRLAVFSWAKRVASGLDFWTTERPVK